jgi:hypothetical protein
MRLGLSHSQARDREREAVLGVYKQGVRHCTLLGSRPTKINLDGRTQPRSDPYPSSLDARPTLRF